MKIIHLLILFFTLLVSYQIITQLFHSSTTLEGLENNVSTPSYKPYNLNDPNNALILAQQNAGNIEVLKGRVDKLDGIKERVDKVQTTVDNIQSQINDLAQQQVEFAQEMVGTTPPTITGTN